MAGDFGGEGVFLQGLAYGLRTSAAYAAGKFAVGYGLPGRDCQEFQIDFLLELGDFFAGYDSVAEGWHGFVWFWGYMVAMIAMCRLFTYLRIGFLRDMIGGALQS